MKTEDVARLVEAELRRVRDVEAEMKIRAMLVRPYPNKPWGVVPLSGYEMGRDWFRSLEEAAKRSSG